MGIWSDRLRNLRRRKGWTQAQLAEALRVSIPTVSSWEVGHSAPSLDRRSLIEELERGQESKEEWATRVRAQMLGSSPGKGGTGGHTRALGHMIETFKNRCEELFEMVMRLARLVNLNTERNPILGTTPGLARAQHLRGYPNAVISGVAAATYDTSPIPPPRDLTPLFIESGHRRLLFVPEGMGYAGAIGKVVVQQHSPVAQFAIPKGGLFLTGKPGAEEWCLLTQGPRGYQFVLFTEEQAMRLIEFTFIGASSL